MRTCPQCQRTYGDHIDSCPEDATALVSATNVTQTELESTLGRKFRLVRRLGAGGMGTVFLAEQIAVGNRPVALKILLRKLIDDPEFLLRFQNEAASTGRIHHANVVTIYESGQADDGSPYIAMEYLEGESLRQALTRRGSFPIAECVVILQQAARGLNAAHKLGIIHRDLKPDNIFLTRSDDDVGAIHESPLHANVLVKIVDFGIAKLRESATHTLTGTVLGTPAYMSFEQASGMKSEELDARSDVYSLGIVAYEMLTGRAPFHSDTPLGYVRKHLSEEPPPFRAVKPELAASPELEKVVMKALAKDRERRFASVMEFARAFSEAASAPQAATSDSPLPSTKIVSPSVGAVHEPPPTPPLPAVSETARASQRKWLWSGWKRVGMIASVFWILGAGIYTLKVTSDQDARTAVWAKRTCLDTYNGQDPDNKCEKIRNDYLDETLPNDRIAAAIVAFVPVPLVWGFIYLVLFLVRRISRAASAHPSRRKWLVVGSLIFLIAATAGGFWFYTSQRQRPDDTLSNKTTLADAYHVTAFRDGAYIIEHKGHRLTAKCRESLAFPDGLDKPGQPMSHDDCTYMVDKVGKSIGDDLMRQEQNQLVFSPLRGLDTEQTADFLDITHDELIRTGSGLRPAQEQVESPIEATLSQMVRTPGEVRENAKDRLKYVWIPPGTFMMGCSPGDSECDAAEKPAHQVTITNGFWMGQTEVTVGAYKRFAAATRRPMPDAPTFNGGWVDDSMPIVNVNWNDAHDYCAWAGARLPTEAEWEYAARGGSAGAHYGNVDEIAWCINNSRGRTHEVAQKRANGFGLFDVLGNVWEWVNDWYDQNYYQSSPSQDPPGPASGNERILRGGSWGDYPRDDRVSNRVGVNATDRDTSGGFRCGGEVFAP